MTQGSSKIKFAHVADVHLDTLMYNLEERRIDFFKAWLYFVDKCIEEKVLFVLDAGDLFEHRATRNIAKRHAEIGLERLKEHGIIYLKIIGNHETKPYRDTISTPLLLQEEGLLQILDGTSTENSKFKIWGLSWRGARTQEALEELLPTIKEQYDGKYTILVIHAGIKEKLNIPDSSTFSFEIFNGVDYLNYIALGHIHKPYTHSNGGVTAYNPGSLESGSVAEAEWDNRGFYIVDVNEDNTYLARKIVTPKRKFVRLDIDAEKFNDSNEIRQHINELVSPEGEPVVKIFLTGAVNYSIKKEVIQEDVVKFSLNKNIIVDNTIPTDIYGGVDVGSFREDLTRAAIREAAIEQMLPGYDVADIVSIYEAALSKRDDDLMRAIDATKTTA